MVVYYESIKREPKIRGIKKCRCDERLKLKQRNLRASIIYYESIKRESKIRGIYECRCDERLQTKTKEFTRLPYTGYVEVYYESGLGDLDVMTDPSKVQFES
jgi:hypothetical protein